jgi:6-pyruvoyltetrahydropterin/6-carboxytetrahydropterin synthase
MKTTIAVSTTFAAAHRLPDHEGKCCRLHGHTYGLEVAVEGAPQESGPAAGMVMDFADLRQQVQTLIVEGLDHQMLNELFDFVPTVEAIAAWAFDVLRDAGIPVVRVRLAEGPNTYVEVTD